MSADLLSVFDIFGGGNRPRINADKTKKILEHLKDISESEDIITAIRSMFNYYPEESVVVFLFQKFFEIRPQDVNDDKYKIWHKHLLMLTDLVQRESVASNWNLALYRKTKLFCPTLAQELWAGYGFSE